MRKINKQIIILSIVLASVFVGNSNISANSATSTIRKGVLNKNDFLMQNNRVAIENSLKNNDYILFTTTVKSFGVKEEITNDQFKVLVSAYTLFKANKSSEAVKLLQDNKVNPVLIKSINNRPDLTNAQKTILKQASDLIKQGKIDEGRALIKTAGLPEVPVKMDKKINQIETKVKKDEIKKAFDQARDLRKQGKLDEAKKVLKDAGIPDTIQEKMRPEFEKNASSTKKISFLQSFKNLFIK
jgi:hypothetical protein